MAIAYSSDLKLSIISTGTEAGVWGQITNTNLVVIQQAIAGYQSLAVNATTGLTLVFTDGAISTGKNAVINLTGTLSGNVNVTVPDAIEKTYYVNNQVTHGAFTLTFKTTSGTGIKLAQGNRYTLYSDGTNVNLIQMNQIYRTDLSNSISGLTEYLYLVNRIYVDDMNANMICIIDYNTKNRIYLTNLADYINETLEYSNNVYRIRNDML